VLKAADAPLMTMHRLGVGGDTESLLSRRAAGRLAGLLYVSSGAFVIVTLPLPQPRGADRSALLAVASARWRSVPWP